MSKSCHGRVIELSKIIFSTYQYRYQYIINININTGLCFPVFEPNTEIYSVKYEKYGPEKTLYLDASHSAPLGEDSFQF